MKLVFAELSLEIIQLVIKEEGEKLEEEKRKGELRVIVEEFVRATPDCNSVEQEWKTLGRSVASAALSQLANALTLACGCNDLKAEALYIAGKCLRSLSFRIDPLHPDAYWNDRFLDERKACEAGRDSATERQDASVEPGSKRLDQLGRETAALKTRRKLAQTYLAQSTEILLQAISVAINNGSMDVLSSASLEICTCLGQFDPCTAGVFLALHQSCVSSVMTEELVLAATLNTSNSQFAALMHLLQFLQKKGDEGPLRKQAEQRLAATSTVWGNLQVTMQFFNIFNELPPNFNLVILQHSDDRSLLYGALLEKTKPVPSQKGKPSHPQKTLQAKVARCSVDREMFTSLLDKMELFKQDMMQSVLKKEDQGSFTRREINKDPAMSDPSAEDGERRQRLAEDFHEIVEGLENYLSPVLLQLDFSPFRQPSPPLSVAESVRVKSRERDDKPVATSSASVHVGDCMILLADKSLQQLPLEALGIFKDDSINTLSRDFSLQLLYNRIHRDHTEESEGKRDVKSARESKPRGEQKKMIKTVPINRVLPANCMPVDTHHFKYIVDPYNDIKEPEALSPVYRMNELLVKYCQQFAANWEGITGASHVPSHAEWEGLMTSCSAFIFYGTERLLAHVLLDKFLAMDFTGCQLMILLDQVRTRQSFSRQSTLDVQKNESHLWLERPVETALMLSVAGVRSMMLNQWYTPLEQNAERLDSLSEYLLALGKTTGQAVRSQRRLGSDSERRVREANSEDTHNEAGQSPRDSRLLSGDPSPYSYILYGLPNMVVM